MTIAELKNKFAETHCTTDSIVAFAPGRVNLIGEHTDYNGGYVFPAALNFGTYAVANKRMDGCFVFSSLNIPGQRLETSDPKNCFFNGDESWANYPLGVLNEFIKKGFGDKITGFELMLFGDVPRGSGLSSSASVEMVTAVIINHLFGLNMPMVEMVKMAQSAENNFVGVNCGIMDQFASGMGKANHAIKLRCSDLDYNYAPIQINGMKIIIANTNAKRGLADSKYNERRAECEAALADIKTLRPQTRDLCELTPTEFEGLKPAIKNPIALKRARHAIYESHRVIEATEALAKNDITHFGQLMALSHESLRDLYDVTGDELDTLFEEAMKISGCVGSRMTGAGFGGCTVSIVMDEAIDDFIETVGKNYTERTGLTASFYTAVIGNGARIL